MSISRTLSLAAETSIATSSHSFNSSSSSSGLTRSSQSSGNKIPLAESTASTSYSTTVPHSFTSISLASTKKAESGSENGPSKVASSTAVASRTSGSSLSVKQSVLTKLAMTTKSATQTKPSVAVSSSSSNGSSASSTATNSRSASASTSFSDVKKSVSATLSGPSSTHSGATSQNSSTSPAHGTSVAVTKPNAGPTSTFSTPVSVPLINSSNGESATVPLFLTSVGTSTNSDGSTIVYTHVIANPTGSFSSGSVMNQSSFLRKPGEVIGAFLAIGVILAALIGCAIYFLRHRQRQRRQHTRVSIKWPPAPADPGFSLSDLPEDPPMRTISIDVRKKPSVVWGPRPDSIAKSSFVGPSRPVSAHTPNESRGMGLAGVGAGGILIDQNVGPFSNLHVVPECGVTTTGLPITTSQGVVRMRTYSYTPSSPSLYPESMKTANEDADSLYEREMGISTQDSHVDTSHISEYRPLTPPASVSSGSSSVTPITRLPITTKPVWSEGTEISQFKERQMGVLTRRSLLNIRLVTPQK